MPACPLYCSLASPLFSLLPSSCPFLSFLPVSFSLVSPLLCSCHMYLYLYVPHIVWCSPIVPVRLGMAHFSFHYDRRTFLRVYVPYFLCPFIWEWITLVIANTTEINLDVPVSQSCAALGVLWVYYWERRSWIIWHFHFQFFEELQYSFPWCLHWFIFPSILCMFPDALLPFGP